MKWYVKIYLKSLTQRIAANLFQQNLPDRQAGRSTVTRNPAFCWHAMIPTENNNKVPQQPRNKWVNQTKWSTQTFDLSFQMILFITIFWAIVCFAGPQKWMYFHVFLTFTVSQETHKWNCPEIGPQLNETHWNDQSGDPPKIQEKSEFHFKFKPVQMRLISKQSLSGFKAAKYKFRSNYVKSPVSQIYKSDRFRIRSNSESSLTVKKKHVHSQIPNKFLSHISLHKKHPTTMGWTVSQGLDLVRLVKHTPTVSWSIFDSPPKKSFTGYDDFPFIAKN